MAEVTLSRQESEEGDLPGVCMQCGARDVELVRRPFWYEPLYLPPLWRRLLRKRMSSYIPLCPAHGGWKFWNGPGLWGLRPKRITKDQITLTGVCDEFVDALRTYRMRREDRDDWQARSPTARSRPGAERPLARKKSSSPAFVWVLAIVGMVIFLPFLCCGGMMLFNFSMLARRSALPPGPALAVAPAAVEKPRLRPEQSGMLGWNPSAGFPAGLPWASLYLGSRKEPLCLLTPAEWDRAVADLAAGNPFTVADAAKRLAEAVPAPQQRQKTARALIPLLSAHQSSVREAGARALGLWGSAEEVPALIDLLNDPFPNVKGAAMEVLATVKDDRGIAAISSRLITWQDRQKARSVLEGLGQPAEKAVIPYLSNADAQVRLEACRLLKVIGSEASLADLKAATTDSNREVARAAADALQAVKARL